MVSCPLKLFHFLPLIFFRIKWWKKTEVHSFTWKKAVKMELVVVVVPC